MTVDVALQVVNYRTLEYTRRCCATFLADLDAVALTWSFTVLDNASGDDLSSLTDQFGPRVSIVQHHENRGFGAGHNHLARDADARFLLVLDPDVEPLGPGLVAALVASADSSRGRDVVGPRLVRPSGQPQRWDHADLTGFPARVAALIGGSSYSRVDRPCAVAWVAGAAMLVRKSAFERVGGFDEGFFLYREDDDLCRRIRESGGQVWYEPSIRVRHIGSVVGRKSRHLAGSTDYYLRKHYAQRPLFTARRVAHRLLKRFA